MKTGRVAALVAAAGVAAAAWAPEPAAAATQALIMGEVDEISIDDPGDVWSRGTIVVGGQRVILPRNLLLDLPANRMSLQQFYEQAPPACKALGQTGVARKDDPSCNPLRRGGSATVRANRLSTGNVIAGEIMLAKADEVVNGVVTYISHSDGYFRINGNPGDPDTGTMIRINDPTGRFTVQQGRGCGAGANCSADERYGVDSDNYTVAFSTGYPVCVPSTLTGVGNRTQGASANGQGDPFCPHTNRGVSPVPDSYKFAPILPGDHLTAEGNFELVNGVKVLSAHTMTVNAALRTALGQPDYLIFSEVEWDAPGFSNQRARLLLIGFSTDPLSQLDVYALHVDPRNNTNHEFPLASTVNNPTTVNQGIAPNAGHIWKINYDVDFLAGVKSDRSPCINLFRAGLSPRCPGGATTNIGQNFSVLSPITREIIGRTRNKTTNGIGDSVDVHGNPAPNGEYLTPVGIGHPEFVEVNVNAIPTPFVFEGEPWNLDRRLSPGGCVPEGQCDATAQRLDPFPVSGLDPRTQAGVPGVPFLQRNEIISYYPFGTSNILALPMQEPPAEPILPVD